MNGGLYDTTEIIKVKSVNQVFNTGEDSTLTVLRDVDFSITANSFTIIFGPSGSGKSTLLNVLAGLQPPTAGTVTVQGHNIYEYNSDELANFRANMVGFVHQTNDWIKSLNVIENISVPLYFLGYSRGKAKVMAEVALERVNMTSYATKYPMLLSGGEQQRIGMARALANDPLFIIADEPTGNLDTENGDAIVKLLLRSQAELRRTVVLVTHNLEYTSLADHLLRINDGEVEDVSGKDTEGILNQPLRDVEKRIQHLKKVKQHALKNS